jgi:ATP-dependent helicase Lhr and Lhr-like helicase
VARRLDVTVERVMGALAGLEREGRVVLGEFRPGGSTREWCDAEVLRQLRRRSLAALRREVEPVEPAALGRFLPGWQGVGSARRGLDALVDAVAVLQGAALPASTLDHDVLPLRVPAYRPADLDALCTSGELVWVGAGGIGSADGRVRLVFRDQAALLLDPADPSHPDRPSGALHEALRAHLEQRGACFWNDLLGAAGGATDVEVLAALWDLVWAAEVTNDSLAPLRAVLGGARPGAATGAARAARGRPRPGRLTRLGPPAGAGRWSLVAPLLEPRPSPTEAAHARALQLLERHGVLTREAVLAEGVDGGFATVYPVLKVLEERGQVRRGYFVAGLGAAQFALPGAVDRLRSAREAPEAGEPLVLAATDPAQPFGAALAWPETAPGTRPARSAGALVVLVGGEPAAWLDRRGHHLVTFPAGAADDAWVAAVPGLVTAGRVRSLEVRRIDGAPVAESSWATSLRLAGFADGYRGLVLRGR